MIKQMADTYPISKPVVTTTTLNLKAGDVIQTGNMFYGFWTYQIINVEPSPYNKNKVALTIVHDNGNSFVEYAGKNTRWSVIKTNKEA
jgi:hypothetical protein